MLKEHNIPQRCEDMHHLKPKSSHRRKKADSISESLKGIVTDSLEFDKNACGDYMESTLAGKTKCSDHQRGDKKGRGKRESHRRFKQTDAKAQEIAFRHQSLHTTKTNTKVLFRKEKSFNDAVRKSMVKVEERERERKQNHRSQRNRERGIRNDNKHDQREETKQQNAALIDNSQEAKERRGKSLEKGYKCTSRFPLLNVQNFNGVQEVVYCQMSHVSPPLTNYKNVAEVKYLYRRSKKRSKNNNQQAGSFIQKSVPCSEIGANPDIVRVEQDLTKFKKEHSESEEFAAETSIADYQSEVERRGNSMRIESEKHKQAGNNPSKVASRAEEHARGQWQQKSKSKRKHHLTRECSQSGNSSHDEHSQIEDHKIHQIVGEAYLRKIQSLIDRKLSTFISKSKDIKKVQHASNASKSEGKGREEYKNRKRVKGYAIRSMIKEDIVNEVLRRLKEESIVEKEIRESRERFSADATKAHKSIRDSAVKVVKNRAHKYNHSRRKLERISSEDQAVLAKDKKDSKTLRNICPDQLADDTESGIGRGIAGFGDRNEFVLEIKGESFIDNDVENTTVKCTNNLNLRCPFKSSLEEYVTNKLTTRLVLAKDHNAELISAYRKGKLYDASTKKKHFNLRKKADLGHECYELKSTINQPKHAKQMFEKSIFSFNLETVARRHRDNIPASIRFKVDPTTNRTDDHCKSEKVNGTSLTLGEGQESLKAMCKKFSILEAFVRDDTFKKALCTCLEFRQECSACKNFLALIDDIQSLFAVYRSGSNGHLGRSQEEDSPAVHDIIESLPLLDDRSESERYLGKSQKDSAYINIRFASALENSSKNKDHHEKSREENSSGIYASPAPPPAPNDTISFEEIYSACLNKFSSDSAVHSDKELGVTEFISCENSKENGWRLIIQPISCLALETASSSSEYFCEDEESIDNEAINRETFLVDLIKPFDHTFNINIRQYNMEMSHFANSESVESGYSSIRSNSYCANCPVNFFEIPKIAALFKPSRSTDWMSNDDLVKNIYSDVMANKYRKPARKVWQMNSLRESGEEENTEFSLRFLLSNNELATLENRTLSTFEDSEVTENEGVVAVMRDRDNISKTQFSEAKAVERAPSSYSSGEWKLILCNSDSNNKSEIQLGSTFVAKLMENEKLHEVQKQFLYYNDASTEGFLRILTRAYDKEVDVCNKLYNDIAFYNVLLRLIQEQKQRKKGAFFKLFSRKSIIVRREKVEGAKSEQEIRLLQKLKIKLQTLGSNARKCFAMLTKTLKVNENINRDQKVCGISEWLERIDNGEFELEQNGESNDLEARITNRVKDSLIAAHKICAKNAKKQKRKIGICEIELLMLVVMKYKFCLPCKADVIISSIGRGIISTEYQLKAAVTYLMRTNAEDINRSIFEEYCKSLNK